MALVYEYQPIVVELQFRFKVTISILIGIGVDTIHKIADATCGNEIHKRKQLVVGLGIKLLHRIPPSRTNGWWSNHQDFSCPSILIRHRQEVFDDERTDYRLS